MQELLTKTLLIQSVRDAIAFINKLQIVVTGKDDDGASYTQVAVTDDVTVYTIPYLLSEIQKTTLGTAAYRNVGVEKGNVSEYGIEGLSDLGYGGLCKRVFTSANTLLKTGFYRGNALEGMPDSGYYFIQQYNHSSDHRIQFLQDITLTPRLYYRCRNAPGWGTTYEYRTSFNTTIDANGFVKKSSPIVSVYRDRIELNELAAAQNIEFVRVSAGDYLIKGTSGFSDDGWYIELPKDANGNPKFAVEYEDSAGDICIKTYQRKWDADTCSVVADKNSPVDISDDRFISIRLNETKAP